MVNSNYDRIGSKPKSLSIKNQPLTYTQLKQRIEKHFGKGQIINGLELIRCKVIEVPQAAIAKSIFIFDANGVGYLEGTPILNSTIRHCTFIIENFTFSEKKKLPKSNYERYR